MDRTSSSVRLWWEFEEPKGPKLWASVFQLFAPPFPSFPSSLRRHRPVLFFLFGNARFCREPLTPRLPGYNDPRLQRWDTPGSCRPWDTPRSSRGWNSPARSPPSAPRGPRHLCQHPAQSPAQRCRGLQLAFRAILAACQGQSTGGVGALSGIWKGTPRSARRSERQQDMTSSSGSRPARCPLSRKFPHRPEP